MLQDDTPRSRRHHARIPTNLSPRPTILPILLEGRRERGMVRVAPSFLMNHENTSAASHRYIYTH